MSQEIKQTDTDANKAAEKHQQPNDQPLAFTGLRRGPAIVVSLLLLLLAAGGGYAIWYASTDFADLAARMTFIMGSALNLAIFLAIIAQACIYWGQRNLMHKQWEAMQAGLNETRRMVTSAEEQAEAVKKQVEIMGIAVEPRLRITNVRVENFDVGLEPVFIVSIENAGATDAKDVELNMRVNLAEQEVIAKRFRRPQSVTIPAHQEHRYPMRWKTSISQDVINSINATRKPVPLMVSGHFKLGDTKTAICYLYYPWEGNGRRASTNSFPASLILTSLL